MNGMNCLALFVWLVLLVAKAKVPLEEAALVATP
jgi:hypothetical protein